MEYVKWQFHFRQYDYILFIFGENVNIVHKSLM